MRSALRGPAHQLAVPVRMRIILSMAIIIIAQSTSHAPPMRQQLRLRRGFALWCLSFSIQYLFSRVKGHKGSPVLLRLLPTIVMGSLLRRAHFESLRAAEAKNSATINQLKYRSRSCITENIALGAWSRENKALGCASCFIGSRPYPRAIFAVMHSHSTLTSI